MLGQNVQGMSEISAGFTGDHDGDGQFCENLREGTECRRQGTSLGNVGKGTLQYELEQWIGRVLSRDLQGGRDGDAAFEHGA